VLLRLKPNGATELVSEIQLYVRPDRSPTLSRFCKELTGITQEQVDGGVPLAAALARYHEWLVVQQLLPPATPGDAQGTCSTAVSSGGGEEQAKHTVGTPPGIPLDFRNS
jgi:inhibitor of KinA sporulation pathway (predicted exonuclease)